MNTSSLYPWVAARFVVGFIFLWAFLDKTFGLGFATAAKDAWIRGGSPTAGFLQFGVTGPFASFFHMLVGSVLVDWLFMLGCLGIGLALMLGAGMRIAGWSGALMVTLMWLSLLFPKNNPIFDEHILELIFLVGLATVGMKSGEVWGIGAWWKQTTLVQKFPFLQ